MEKENNKDKNNNEHINVNIDLGIGKLFGNLKNLIDVISNMSSEESNKSGQFMDSSGKIKGIYGFSIKTVGDNTSVEEFGNKLIKDDKDGGIIIDKLREPFVDIIEEEEIYTIVAEMPGVRENDLQIEVLGDIIQIKAKSSTREYEKEVLLKSKVSSDPISRSLLNGILELKLKKLNS